MATGYIKYWNGLSGWIKQTNVDNVPTVYARDILLLRGDLLPPNSPDVSPTVDDNVNVSFDIEQTSDFPWLARNVVPTS